MKTKTIKELKSAAWFLIKLNILAIPLYLIVTFGYSFPPLQDLWALALDQSLSSLGYETELTRNLIYVKTGDTAQQILFSWDSTGWKSLYALTVLVFASGIGTFRNKLRFLSFGLPLVIFVNLVRVLTTVVFPLEFGFQYFDFIHNFLWSSLMIAFVVWIWYWLFFRGRQTNNISK